LKILKTILTFLFCILCSFYASEAQTSLAQDKYIAPIFEQYESNNSTDKFLKEDSSTLVKNISASIINEFSALNPTYIFSDKLAELQSILHFEDLKFNKTVSDEKSKLEALLAKSNIGGSLVVESYISNQQTPFSLNEAKYTRLSATPNLSILGLPFSSDIFLTTEDNSYFNSNSFTINFDLDTYKSSLKDGLEKKYEDRKKELYNLSEFEQDIDNYKSDINRKISNLERQAKEEKENQQKELEANLKEQQESLKTRIQDSASSTKDSIQNIKSGRQSQLDSLTQRKDSIYNAYLKKRSDIEDKIIYLKSFVDRADSIEKKVSNSKELVGAVLTQQKQVLDKKAATQKGKFITKARDSISHSKGIQHLLSTIEEFQIGLTNPYFSDNTLNGIPIKGINIKRVSPTSSLYTRLAVGNSVASFNPFDRASRNDNRYSRRVISVKTGYGDEDYNDIYFISMNMWDPVNADSSQEKNTVNSIGYNFVANKISLKSEVSYSHFESTSENLEVSKQFAQGGIASGLYNNLAIITQMDIKLGKRNKIKVKYDQKNPNFRSLGSPFLRNNYRLFDLVSTNSIAKNKIHLSGFYKFFEDNITHLSENTNKMKGFGATLQTNFKKYPNLMVSYSPFEQSNNHQDSLLRTNNKFKSLNSQLTYNKSIDKHFFQTIVSHNLAIIEYEESDFIQSNTSILSINQLYQNDKLNASIGYMASRTYPSIDSLSFNSINANFRWRLKKLKVGGSVNHRYSLSNGKSLSQSIFIELPLLKSSTLKIESGVRYFDNVWGLSDEMLSYGMLTYSLRI
jgi:hypothetical protein